MGFELIESQKGLEKYKLCEKLVEYLCDYNWTLRRCSYELVVPYSTLKDCVHIWLPRFEMFDELEMVKRRLRFNKKYRFCRKEFHCHYENMLK